ncbi:MAG: hypothetical protein ACXQT3_02970 [Methermicoccaceae archaeon]
MSTGLIPELASIFTNFPLPEGSGDTLTFDVRVGREEEDQYGWLNLRIHTHLPRPAARAIARAIGGRHLGEDEVSLWVEVYPVSARGILHHPKLLVEEVEE